MSNNSIVIDEYEAINLLSALNAITSWDISQKPNNPLQVLNSGDWVGQLQQKLVHRLQLVPPNPQHTETVFDSIRYGHMYPNRTPEQYVHDAQNYIQWMIHKGSTDADQTRDS